MPIKMRSCQNSKERHTTMANSSYLSLKSMRPSSKVELHQNSHRKQMMRKKRRKMVGKGDLSDMMR